jgi:uncharacterized RDD family membrane protein YckC
MEHMSEPARVPLHETTLDDGTELITGEAVALDVRPTGFILRAAGAIIDYVVSILVFVGLMLAMFSWILSGVAMDTAMFTAIVLGLTVLCLVVLPAAVEIATRGRSLGRLVVGARIVRDDGGAPGFRHAFIRALTGYFEIYATAGGIAALTGLLSARSKRLGDVLAGTYSQRERPTAARRLGRRRRRGPTARPAGAARHPVPQAGRLTDPGHEDPIGGRTRGRGVPIRVAPADRSAGGVPRRGIRHPQRTRVPGPARGPPASVAPPAGAERSAAPVPRPLRRGTGDTA